MGGRPVWLWQDNVRNKGNKFEQFVHAALSPILILLDRLFKV